MGDLSNLSGPAEPGHRSIYRRWWFWVVATPVVLFIALVIYRIPAVREKERTQQVVAQIHSQKLTINDVNGEHLPPPPDPAQVDATIAGLDANGNGIRDDVELAIFEKYPNSARIRSAELQYSMGLQMYLTKVFNSDTLVAVIQEENRASLCIGETTPHISSSDNSERIKEVLSISKARQKEVEKLVFNTGIRQKTYQDAFRYMTSYGGMQGDACDLDLAGLSN